MQSSRSHWRAYSNVCRNSLRHACATNFHHRQLTRNPRTNTNRTLSETQTPDTRRFIYINILPAAQTNTGSAWVRSRALKFTDTHVLAYAGKVVVECVNCVQPNAN